jgi:hypothetical protein
VTPKDRHPAHLAGPQPHPHVLNPDTPLPSVWSRAADPQPAPTTEVEVFQNIFDYIDRLFSIVRPRRVLFMAIGGCGLGSGALLELEALVLSWGASCAEWGHMAERARVSQACSPPTQRGMRAHHPSAEATVGRSYLPSGSPRVACH